MKEKSNKERPILSLTSLMDKFVGTEVTILLTMTLTKDRSL